MFIYSGLAFIFVLSFIEKSKSKKKMVLAQGTTETDIKNYVKERQLENFPELDERKKGRKTGAIYAAPYGLAPLEETGKRIDPSTGRIADEGKRSRDVAMVIWEEIYNHGRSSIDEIIKRYKGYDPMLLQIVVNLMIDQKYLKKHFERKEKLYTLEVLTEDERNKKLTRSLGKLESKNTKSP